MKDLQSTLGKATMNFEKYFLKDCQLNGIENLWIDGDREGEEEAGKGSFETNSVWIYSFESFSATASVSSAI
jgi:hypothetical protein